MAVGTAAYTLEDKVVSGTTGRELRPASDVQRDTRKFQRTALRVIKSYQIILTKNKIISNLFYAKLELFVIITDAS